MVAGAFRNWQHFSISEAHHLALVRSDYDAVLMWTPKTFALVPEATMAHSTPGGSATLERRRRQRSEQ
jgi:hypothetical protein